MKNIKYILSSAILTFFILGCDVQEASQDVMSIGNTDDFSLPSFSLSSTGSGTNEADETVYTYLVTLDKPLVNDVALSFKVLDGTTATEDVDFEFVNTNVRAYETTATMDIIIHNDSEVEETEFLNVAVIPGPAPQSSHSLNPLAEYPELSITIDNFESGDLDVGMEWAADNGSGSSGYELADLILLITDAASPYTEVIGGSDGGSAEHVTISSDTPDGDYFVVADVYAMDDSDFDIDINVTFDQGGVIQGAKIESPKAMNSRILCNEYVVLAKITKSGTSYSWATENAALTNNGIPDTDLAAPFLGTATVLNDDWADDYVDGKIEIEAGSNPNEFYVRMYSNPYINNPDTAYLIVTINDVCGNVTGVSNEPWDYDNVTPVTATGTLDLATKTIDLSLDYYYGMGTHYPGQQLLLQLP